MEGVTSNIYRNLKSFWRRRGYQRLKVASTRRRRSKAEIDRAVDPNRRTRRWKIKIVPKLQLISPKKLLIRFRDTYVNFMLRLASSPAMGSGGGGFGAVDYGFGGFGMRPMKEYDEKVIVEIYKSIVMAQGKMVVCDGAHINSPVVCSPKSKSLRDREVIIA